MPLSMMEMSLGSRVESVSRGSRRSRLASMWLASLWQLAEAARPRERFKAFKWDGVGDVSGTAGGEVGQRLERLAPGHGLHTDKTGLQ